MLRWIWLNCSLRRTPPEKLDFHKKLNFVLRSTCFEWSGGRENFFWTTKLLKFSNKHFQVNQMKIFENIDGGWPPHWFWEISTFSPFLDNFHGKFEALVSNFTFFGILLVQNYFLSPLRRTWTWNTSVHELWKIDFPQVKTSLSQIHLSMRGKIPPPQKNVGFPLISKPIVFPVIFDKVSPLFFGRGGAVINYWTSVTFWHCSKHFSKT